MREATLANFHESLTTLALRDGSVELCTVESQGTVGTTYTVRVLEMLDGGQVLVDLPSHPQAAEQLQRGAQVSLLAVDGGRRLVGYCQVLGLERYELAGGQQTRALRLSRATSVESAQRRRFFRVNAGAATAHPIELFCLDPHGSDRELLEDKPIKAYILNIGGGGVGVTVRHAGNLSNTLRRTNQFLASLVLPGTDGERLKVGARLVHIQVMTSDTLYLGFEFTFCSMGEQRRVEDQLVRLTTYLQRQQIRRQRGA